MGATCQQALAMGASKGLTELDYFSFLNIKRWEFHRPCFKQKKQFELTANSLGADFTSLRPLFKKTMASIRTELTMCRSCPRCLCLDPGLLQPFCAGDIRLPRGSSPILHFTPPEPAWQLTRESMLALSASSVFSFACVPMGRTSGRTDNQHPPGRIPGSRSHRACKARYGGRPNPRMGKLAMLHLVFRHLMCPRDSKRHEATRTRCREQASPNNFPS